MKIFGYLDDWSISIIDLFSSLFQMQINAGWLNLLFIPLQLLALGWFLYKLMGYIPRCCYD